MGEARRRREAGPTGVCICTPTVNNTVTAPFMLSVFLMVSDLQSRGIGIDIRLCDNMSTVHIARTLLVAGFMANPSFSHLLFVDSDESWEATAAARLLAHNKEIIGAPVPFRALPITWNYQGAGTIDEHGLLPVTFIGCGFLLIARSAVEKMIRAYPERHCPTMKGATAELAPWCYSLFPTQDGDGTPTPEDVGFCRLALAAGVDLWIDPGIEIEHHTQHSYHGVLSTG